MDRKHFGNSVLRAIYDLNGTCNQIENALEDVLSEIEDLTDLNELKVRESRHKYFQIPHTSPESYKERFLEVAPGKSALAGIRHVNGEKDRPFVHLLLGFEPSRDEIETIKHTSINYFADFSPIHVGFWLRPSSATAQNLEEQGYAARRYIVGNIENISKSENPPGYERLTLNKMDKAPDRQWYENAYADFHRKSPELESWVPTTDEEELQNCARDGMLYQILVDGHNAGIIGGQRKSLLGRSGVYMTELLLTEPFRGKGLATALQRKFLDCLDSNLELVWGTIDARNLPSTRTALKVGRKPIRTEFFVPLPTSSRPIWPHSKNKI